MIDYEQIEDDVVEKLSSLASDSVLIMALPQSEVEHTKTVNTKITVAYGGSKYSENEGGGNIVQREEVNIILFFESRRSRGDLGLYKTMAAAQDLLIGLEPTYCGKMFLRDQSPMERKDGLFSFQQTYGCYSLLTETIQDEEYAPLEGIEFTKN